ncbi:small multi-drug export protein [Candidatus Woesearchaeota archaeon]|nr:small multi-drug export protein [Candidatus Woesearchaeota archaeon]
MIEEIIILVLLTLIPFLELRASIPYGILVLHEGWIFVFIVCVISNIILVPLIWFFLHHVIHIFLKIKWIDRVYQKFVEKSQKKVKPYVKKYGKIGLALFIGIPLPGSGVYSGGLGAYLLGFKFKDYLKASVIGVLIAGVAMTLISLFANETLGFLIKVI